MAAPKPLAASYADLEALPDTMVGEILFGALHAHPRPAPRHAVAANALGTEVSSPFQFGRGGPGGWIFMTEPELHLGPHVVVPDIASWKRERLPEPPATAYIEVAPDWVCEVLSPSTMRIDRTDKLAVYRDFAVPYLWYVDPDARTLEVLELQHGHWVIVAALKDDDEVAAAPFAVHAFKLDGLWW